MCIGSKKLRMVCFLMVFHIIVCIFLGLTWPSEQKTMPKAQPTKFWTQENASKAFWNREQERLNFYHNPNFRSQLSSWMESAELASEPCEPSKKVRQEIGNYNVLPKLFQDFLLNYHCKSFPMLINQPAICIDEPFLLLAVKTLIPHFDRRQAIRESWGKAEEFGDKKVVTVFLVGNTVAKDHHPGLSGLLRYEAEMYKDILQWDFRDTFLNLTLKDILFLNWFKSFCPNAKFILKGDDDVFANTHHIVNYLDNLPPSKVPDLFFGDVIYGAGPIRDTGRKYFIPESYFDGGYPPYAGGGGVIYSGQLALKLQSVSEKLVIFPIDDVYTGMCLKKLGVAPQRHGGFKTFDIEEKDKHNPCIYRNLMLVHSRTPQEMKRIWKWITLPELECQ